MARIGARLRSYLEGRFAGRASFSKTERKLYGHDIAAIPSLIKPLVGDTIPEAVVQPETEDELVELLATGQVPVARSLLQARECMGCRQGEEPLHRHAAWQGF